MRLRSSVPSRLETEKDALDESMEPRLLDSAGEPQIEVSEHVEGDAVAVVVTEERLRSHLVSTLTAEEMKQFVSK